MKPSTILVLLVLCAALIAGLLLIKGERPKVLPPANVGEKLVKIFDSDNIKSVQIKKGDVAVKLEKKDKDWVLSSQKDRPASKDRVDTLLRSVKEAMREGVRVSKEDKEFELDEPQRTELTLQGGESTTTLYLGKSPTYGRTFARTEPNGPILEVDKGLDSDSGVRTEGEKRILDPAHFYDLKVLSFTSDDVIDLVLKKGHEVTRVQKVIPGKGPLQGKQEPGKDDPKPVWWVTEPEGIAADDGNVSSILSTFSSLNVKSYADDVPEKDRGFDKPSAKLKLTLKDGTEHTVTFGKLQGDDVIISVSGKTDAYKVYKYIFENATKDLRKTEEEKKAETPATMPPLPMPPLHVEEKKAETPPAPAAKVEPPKKATETPAAATPEGKEKPKVEEKKQ